MSSHATFNVPYDMNDRDRRKKAFIRRRKRKRLLLVLSFFVIAIILVALIVMLLVNLIKKKNQERDERMAYVDYDGEYKEIWLIDNSMSGKESESAFFEIFISIFIFNVLF